jgi:hypothetical protein
VLSALPVLSAARTRRLAHCLRLTAVLTLVLAGGCTRDIPNTTVPDTAANREVIEFMETYRRALEDREVATLIGMASPRYLDMSGTPTGTDDVDYDTLTTILPELFARVEDIRFEIRYRHVVFRDDDVLVEFRYTASYLIADHRGENEWHHKVEDKRMVLEWDSENARYLIMSGM